jgi:hypothetical protein
LAVLFASATIKHGVMLDLVPLLELGCDQVAKGFQQEHSRVDVYHLDEHQGHDFIALRDCLLRVKHKHVLNQSSVLLALSHFRRNLIGICFFINYLLGIYSPFSLLTRLILWNEMVVHSNQSYIPESRTSQHCLTYYVTYYVTYVFLQCLQHFVHSNPSYVPESRTSQHCLTHYVTYVFLQCLQHFVITIKLPSPLSWVLNPLTFARDQWTDII